MGFSNVVRLAAEKQRRSMNANGGGCRIPDGEPVDRFQWIATSNDFDYFAILSLDSAGRYRINPSIKLTSFPPEFLAVLAQVGELGSCSLFYELGVTTAPFGWDVGVQLFVEKGAELDLEFSDPVFDELLEQSGVGGGYCVPVHGPHGERAVVIYFGTKRQAGCHYAELVLATLQMFEEFRNLQRADNQNARELTDFETALLRGLASGSGVAELATRSRLSEHSIYRMLIRARTKLDAKTTAQAVRKLMGWADPEHS